MDKDTTSIIVEDKIQHEQNSVCVGFLSRDHLFLYFFSERKSLVVLGYIQCPAILSLLS